MKNSINYQMTTRSNYAIIEREYSQGGSFQWVRETLQNAIEAGATKVHFGVDAHGVAATNTYRRFIADNGRGMNAQELEDYFNHYGEGGKPIGGAHENFGIGAKIALLPWNTTGVLVLSWQEGEGNAIWLWKCPDDGEYGLHRVRSVDGGLLNSWNVSEDPEELDFLGFRLEELKPEWITTQGTVLLLLGEHPRQHTILNDSNRQKDTKAGNDLHKYIDQRYWQLPEGITVTAAEMYHDTPEEWAEKFPEGVNRTLRGAAEAIVTDGKFTPDRYGVITGPDGTRFHWFFADPERKKSNWRIAPFIAVLYNGELYEHRRPKKQFWAYRQFGIGLAEVRENLWIVIEPTRATFDRRGGIAPRADRSTLLWYTDRSADPAALPWDEWQQMWVEQMPDLVREALNPPVAGGEVNDPEYLRRLAMVYGERFKISINVVTAEGTERVRPTPQTQTGNRGGGGGEPTGEGTKRVRTGRPPGSTAASRRKGDPRVPIWKPAGPEDVENGMMASYVSAKDSAGIVYLQVEHPVMRDMVQFWTERFPRNADEVRKAVHDAYGEAAVLAVAHAHSFEVLGIPPDEIRDDMLSPNALTMSLLGLKREDKEISDLLKSRVGKRQS